LRLLAVVAVIYAAAIGLLAAPDDVEAARYKGKIGGGPTGGTYTAFANAVAAFVPEVESNIRLSAVGSGGSWDNIRRIDDGELAFGLCNAIDAQLAWEGRSTEEGAKYQRLRAVGYLGTAVVQLAVRANSAITSAAGLAGKRIAIGNAGSGAATSAERFFRHLDLWGQVKPVYLGYSAAAGAFEDGTIEAFWVIVGYPSRAVVSASIKTKIRLLDIGIQAAESNFYARYAYVPTEVPAGTYGAAMPACTTFSDAEILVCSARVPTDVVFRVARALWSEQGLAALAASHKMYRKMSVDNGLGDVTIPLHPGAAKFWTQQGTVIPENLTPP